MAARLTQKKVNCVIRARKRGVRAADIAMHLGVTARHVQRLWAEYLGTGRAHVQRKAGRPGKGPTAAQVRAVLAEHDAYGRGGGAIQTAESVRDKCHMSYRAAYRIMREAGRVTPSVARSRRRIWVRYERKYANALWHTGWHIMELMRNLPSLPAFLRAGPRRERACRTRADAQRPDVPVRMPKRHKVGRTCAGRQRRNAPSVTVRKITQSMPTSAAGVLPVAQCA